MRRSPSFKLSATSSSIPVPPNAIFAMICCFLLVSASKTRLLAIAFSENNIQTFQEGLKGFLLEKPTRIVPGYLFRSLFYLPEIGKTLGELNMEEEARVAHRKKALGKALPILKKLKN